MKSRIGSTFLHAGLLLLVFAPRVHAQSLSVPGDYATIQAAITAAADGDTVLVEEGTYIENINFMGKAITVGSRFMLDQDTSHIFATVIDGSEPTHPDTASTVFFVSGEDSTSVLIGFTITGGTGTMFPDEDFETARGGGGIFAWNASPRIMRNRIMSNQVEGAAWATGGAILAYQETSPDLLILEENIIWENTVIGVEHASGGGIALSANARIYDNELYYNQATSTQGTVMGGGLAVEEYDYTLSVTLSSNRVNSNRAVAESDGQAALGGAMYLNLTNTYLLENEISGNEVSAISDVLGGGVVILPAVLSGDVQVVNNLFTYNSFTGRQSIGGALTIIDGHNVNLRNNRFDVNVATFGAGILMLRTRGQLFNNQFNENEATYTGGAMHVERSNVVVSGSHFVENRAVEGGAIFSYEASPVIRRNIFDGNTASEAGGALMAISIRSEIVLQEAASFRGFEIVTSPRGIKYARATTGDEVRSSDEIQTYYGAPMLTNNTIVNNSAQGHLGGGGINANFASVELMNNILWGNTATDGAQVEGSVMAMYNTVQGGLEGIGNIDADPMFAEDSPYYLDPASPAVDAGNPETQYNDVEDPGQIGQALYPSLGGLRNDMGAWGGPVDYVEPDELLGPVFRDFVVQLTASAPNLRQEMAEAFLETITSFPLIEQDNIVYYLYRGEASRITVPGDANGWMTDAFPMTRLTLTDLWYREAVYEADARLDYKFVINNNTWILDPLNPNQVTGGYGPNSELAMPAYVQPPEIAKRDGAPSGQIQTYTFQSSVLGNQRTIQVYTPPGYDETSSRSYPVLLLHDGLEFISLASANTTLDNLIADERIQPLIAIFVPPKDRDNEYAFTKKEPFEEFIIDELMPYIDANFRTRVEPEYRAMGGISFGGLISALICYNNPDHFGNTIWMSAAFWPEDRAVLNKILDGPTVDMKIYVDWGTYETDIMTDGRTMRDALPAKGYEVEWREWHDGHSWGNWRAHLDDALEFIFPGKAVNVDEPGVVPTAFRLHPNYPNPFNPATTIVFDLPQSSSVRLSVYDITGRHVGTLVDGSFAAGSHTHRWDAAEQSSGVYFMRMETPEFSQVQKMMLIK